MTSTKTYDARAETHKTAVGRRLLAIMARKRTNLCISLDIPDPERILALLSSIGPKICCAKTHIDAVPFVSLDAIASFTAQLSALARQHNFLLFEDRKFADIGATVAAQYAGGVYNIVRWADITNAHSVPGPGVIAGLKSAIPPPPSGGGAGGAERGLLLLGEMSSAGNLGGGEYLARTVAMARAERDFVMGFVAQCAIAPPPSPAGLEGQGGVGEGQGGEEEDWIVMTPGVNLGRSGDALGQQYNTPDRVVRERGCDVIIVGRGIVAAADPVAEAERYRAAGWEAYEHRVAQS